MAKITTITNPLTGQPAQVDQLDHTAQQIDDAVALAPQLSNPNLLDNWYFGNPVNQRGQTSYTGAGYGIDRWRFNNNGVLLINDGYITFINKASWIDGICEPIEPELMKSIIGKTVTASILLRNWQLYSTTITLTSGASTSMFAGAENNLSFYYNTDSSFVVFSANTDCEVQPIAVKLELGSQQTLAHQDENGVWQLNEIPDYGEQLARCMAYAVQLEKNGGIGIVQNETTAYLIFPLSVPLKLRPGINPGIIQNYPVSAWTSKGDTEITNAVLNDNYNGKQSLCLTITGDFSGVQSGSVITSNKFAPFISNDL